MIRIKGTKSTLVFNPNNLPENGIVYLYADWSLYSEMYLTPLIRCLDNYEICLYIYDIDENQYKDFANKHLIKSQGYGETFWLNKGKIIHEISDYKNIDINIDVVNYTKQLLS